MRQSLVLILEKDNRRIQFEDGTFMGLNKDVLMKNDQLIWLVNHAITIDKAQTEDVKDSLFK